LNTPGRSSSVVMSLNMMPAPPAARPPTVHAEQKKKKIDQRY
jgi:hypothetical protein